jgi:glutamine synthetase
MVDVLRRAVGSGIEDDRPMALTEEGALRLEEVAAHPDTVDEDDGCALSLVLLVQLHPVDRDPRHGASLPIRRPPTIFGPSTGSQRGISDVGDDLDQARELIEADGIDTVECLFADTWGIPRGKRIPAKHFLKSTDSGFAIANVAFTWDMHCFIFPTVFVDDEKGYPDMHAVPDLSTLRKAGYREATAFCICDTVDPHTHEPIPLDGRNILRRAVERLRRTGYEPVVATELEFHLCTPDWEPFYRGVHCYSIAKGAEVEPVVGDIRRALDAAGITVEACNVEYGPAQVEVNLGYGPAIEIADATVVFKSVVKQVAAAHGLRATFMAKPFMGDAGNGLHIHQSLQDGDGGNAFAVKDDDAPLYSSLMRRYLAGLVAHQLELQAVMCPTINAYKRVEDYSFAPTQVTWGLDHRLVGVRSVPDQGPATRLEARWASADSNPYLVLAGCLAAGADGLEREHDVPPMVTGDPHVDATLERLPVSLEGAVANFERSSFVRDVYGEVFVDTFLAMLRHEIDLYARHVTEWEFERYREVM